MSQKCCSGDGKTKEEVEERWCVTKLRVKDGVRNMVCDKAVCERWCVTKLCVKDCVCVTKWCERWCVKDGVKDGVPKMVGEKVVCVCVKDGV